LLNNQIMKLLLLLGNGYTKKKLYSYTLSALERVVVSFSYFRFFVTSKSNVIAKDISE